MQVKILGVCMKPLFSKTKISLLGAFLVLLLMQIFMACASTPKLNAEAISDQCDVIIEVRSMGETLTMVVGKTVYL